MASATLVTVSEYLRSSYEPDAEFVDGTIEERPMGERDHSDLQTQLLLLLGDRANRPYFIVRSELRVQTLPEHFRVPDLCVLRAGIAREQIVRTPPLLCVEILSPEDTLSKTLLRVREFLAMGVAEVWIVDPQQRTLSICAGETISQRSDGSIQVPGTPIALKLQHIFSVLDET